MIATSPIWHARRAFPKTRFIIGDLGAHVLGVGCDGAEGLRRGAEEQVVDLALVLEGNGGDGGGKGEDHME